MSRTGWNLISTRFSLTKVPSSVLSEYYRKGYPFTPKMADRPYNTIHYSEDKWDQLCGWLTGNPTFRLQLASHKQALGDHMGCSQETTDPSNKAGRTDPPKEAGSSSPAAGSSWHSKPPPRLRPQGGPTGGGSSVVLIRSLPTQQQPLSSVGMTTSCSTNTIKEGFFSNLYEARWKPYALQCYTVAKGGREQGCDLCAHEVDFH